MDGLSFHGQQQPHQHQQPGAFGVSVKELAAAGQPPIVLQDCLRWLALRGLTTPRLFAGVPRSEERKLLALRHLYDTGRRPLRSKTCRDKDPHLVAALLLSWLRSLPEPVFPAALVPELVDGQQSDYYDERVTSVRALLKRADPYVVEALFPTFELLHHYWINQVDRDSCLQELGRLLAPAVFGAPATHGLPAEDAGLLSDTVEMLISEYRPLFTQPFNLRRYEADLARQAAAAQQAEVHRAESTTTLGSPLLTPIRCERLSVMAPEGGSPFSDCCGTPLPASPVSLFLTMEADVVGASFTASPQRSMGLHNFQHLPASLAECGDVAPGVQYEDACIDDACIDQAFSDMLESTVSGMLFDLPLFGADAGFVGAGCAPVGADQPGSPVAVLRELACDGGDSSDGSDCEAPMACLEHSSYAWDHAAHIAS